MRTEEGLLTWDGSVLEHFSTDGRDNSWRVHAATVQRWEIEQRRGVSLLKAYYTDKHCKSALVADSSRPMIQALMAEVDAVR